MPGPHTRGATKTAFREQAKRARRELAYAELMADELAPYWGTDAKLIRGIEGTIWRAIARSRAHSDAALAVSSQMASDRRTAAAFRRGTT